MKTPRKHRSRSLQFESLESREVMAAGVTASLASAGVLQESGPAGSTAVVLPSPSQSAAVGSVNLTTIAASAAAVGGASVSASSSVQLSYYKGVLTVTGTNSDDSIKFLQGDGWLGIQGGTQWFSARTVSSIVVNLQGGDDTVSFDSLRNGCNQEITAALTVNAGAGTSTIRLPNSQSTSLSGAGNTLTYKNGVTKLNGTKVDLPEVVRMVLSGGVLTVTGKSGDDVLCFLQGNGWLGIYMQDQWFAASSVNSIVLNLQGGNDYVSLDSQYNGCNQAITAPITVNWTSGYKMVICPNGNTSISNYGSHQLKVLSSGAVTLDGHTLWPAPEPDPAPDPDPDPNPPATNWFDTNVNDAALRDLGHNLYTDGMISRSDIISLLREAEDGGIIDSTELSDLRLISNTASLFGGVESVQKLTGYAVASNTAANVNYQGGALGNLSAGSSTAQMEKLINKWFLGLDRPTASGTYRQVAGTLFVNGASYGDVRQGSVGDCYFVMSLGEVAFRDPSTITSMFTTNGDGTYAVRFYNGSQAYYVTVDSYLPTNGSGGLIYASMGSSYTNSSNELWVALAEKAYAQLNEFGFSRSGFTETGQNSYAAIDGGYIYAALGHISGLATTPFAMTSYSSSFTTFVNAYNAGKMIGFASYQTPPSGSGVVGSHAYAVVGYNSSNQTITLFNPWGTQYGLLTLTWSQVQAGFMYFDRTA